MSDIAINIENLSKSYLVGHNAAQSGGYTALRDVIARNARSLARKTRDMLQGRAIVQGDEIEEFWALKDISFQIKRGDRVGILGRNGAGKSTLLKVLSRITEPTTGRIKIAGRVASLLEVGTGFHPELTGRENIFLNGAILGMSRREIQRNFDAIVDFAEVEKFLDTPVKRYSSGMYVRLAFAVAAHLQSEILIVDEVLAVGDAQFQKKCLGKMSDVAADGRTVLFVSHNMGAIRNLCSSALWLDNGNLLKAGETAKIVNEYEEAATSLSTQFSCVTVRDSGSVKSTRLHFIRAEILNTEELQVDRFKYNEVLLLNVSLGGQLMGGVFSTEFYIHNELGILVSVGASGPYHGVNFGNDVTKLRIEIGPLTITSGSYKITLSLMAGHERIDNWESAITFTITECQPFQMSWEIPANREGVCVLQHSFRALNRYSSTETRYEQGT